MPSNKIRCAKLSRNAFSVISNHELLVFLGLLNYKLIPIFSFLYIHVSTSQYTFSTTAHFQNLEIVRVAKKTNFIAQTTKEKTS